MDPNYFLQNPSYLAPNPPPPPPPRASDPIISQELLLDNKDRFPQWSQAETKELLSIRAQLDHSFIATKRNKPLWESAAAKMQQRGFSRTPEQCKSKWKNLVNRYKAGETTEGERPFAFKEEMRSIFEHREERPQCSDKISKGKEIRKRRKGEGEVEEALREFGRKQMEMEMRWMEAAEARDAERRQKEEEWRLRMAALVEERMEMERRWMEREDERRAGEEAREERRHAIITAIVGKILEKDSF